MQDINNETQPVLSDKSIKFDNAVYTKNGWAVFLAGGPGASKSTVIKNQLLIEGAVLDCDNILNYYVKYVQHLLDTNSLTTQQSEEIYEIFDNLEFDLKNPKTNNRIYFQINNKKALFVKKLLSFIKAHKKYLENLVIDSTGNNINAMYSTANILKSMGYKLSFVWVVANIKDAISRNTNRKRTVDIDYLIDVHKKLLTTLPEMLETNSLNMFDEAWIIFSHNITNFSTSYNEKYSNTAVQLKKTNTGFEIPIKLKRRIITQVDKEHIENGEQNV